MKKRLLIAFVASLLAIGKAQAQSASTMCVGENMRCFCIEGYVKKNKEEADVKNYMTHYLKKSGEAAATDFFKTGDWATFAEKAEAYCNISDQMENPMQAVEYYTEVLKGIPMHIEGLYGQLPDYSSVSADALREQGVLDEYISVLVEPYMDLDKDGHMHYTVRVFIPRGVCEEVYENIKDSSMCSVANYCKHGGISMASRNKMYAMQ